MSSTKSAIGHLLGGAGAVETIFCILAIRDQIVPPTLNLDNPSEGTRGRRPGPAQGQEAAGPAVLNNSFGFGGTNASPDHEGRVRRLLVARRRRSSLAALIDRLFPVVGARARSPGRTTSSSRKARPSARSRASSTKQGAIPGTAQTYYVMARLFGSRDPIQAGEFEIPKGMGGAAILDLLQHGKPVQRLITVTEGMPSIIVQEKLAAIPYLTGPVPPIEEGSVLPDSYGYQRGETRAAVVERMQAAMTKTLDAALAEAQQPTARSRRRSRRSSSPRSSRRRPARRPSGR